MTYFNNPATLDDLKKQYKHLAQKHHPDVGGDTATMQAINAEYAERFEVLKRTQNTQAAEDVTGRTRATTESAGDFIAIVSLLLSLDGLEVELCGRWLWIGGNTRAHKEALKAAGEIVHDQLVQTIHLCPVLHHIRLLEYSAMSSASAMPSLSFRHRSVRRRLTPGNSRLQTAIELFLSPVIWNSFFHFWGVTSS